MKNLMKTAFLILVISVVTFSCQDDLQSDSPPVELKNSSDNTYNKSDKSLANQLAVNSDFIELVTKTHAFTQTYLDTSEIVLKNEELRDSVHNMQLDDFEKINALLNLQSRLSSDYALNVEQITANLKVEFPILSKMSEIDISDTFTDAYLIVVGVTSMSRNSCDEQFQDDMQTIHVGYDSSLMVCAAVGLFTGGGGLLPCAAVATGVAVIQTAIAIDAHTTCNLGQ
jgi:hypothetical protein